jgi:hypothetical protein
MSRLDVSNSGPSSSADHVYASLDQRPIPALDGLRMLAVFLVVL